MVDTGFTTLRILLKVCFLCPSPITILGEQNPKVEGMGAKECPHHGMCFLSLTAPSPDSVTTKRRILRADSAFLLTERVHIKIFKSMLSLFWKS